MLEALLILLTVEESAFVFSVIVKREACGLVKVKNEIETVCLAGINSNIELSEALLAEGAILVFEYIIVKWDTDMVYAP